MNQYVVAAFAVAFAMPGGSAQAQVKVDAPSGKYAMDRGHSTLIWKLNHSGLNKYQARFDRFEAELNFDAASPEKSAITVKVDPASVSTGYAFAATKDFDKELRDDPRFLKVGQFPEIRFVSKSVERTGDRTAKINGELMLMGVTKPMTINATFNGSFAQHPASKVGAIGFSGTGVVKRSDFGLTALLPFVGDEVEILVEAQFQQAKTN